LNCLRISPDWGSGGANGINRLQTESRPPCPSHRALAKPSLRNIEAVRRLADERATPAHAIATDAKCSFTEADILGSLSLFARRPSLVLPNAPRFYSLLQPLQYVRMILAPIKSRRLGELTVENLRQPDQRLK
jgi:hypothetical protein